MIAHIDPNHLDHEQTVLEHLKGTAQIASNLGTPLEIENLAYLAGLYHDLGKWRKKFETYIRTTVLEGEKRNHEKINHSSAGAIYIYRRYYHGSYLEKLTAQLLCQAILSHHGLSDCITMEGEDTFHKRVKNLDKLDYEEIIGNLKNSTISEEEMDEVFEKAVGEVSSLQNKIRTHSLSFSFTNGLICRMLLSLLIDSDHLDTAVFCGDRSSDDLSVKREVSWEVPAGNLERTLSRFPQKAGIFSIRRKIAKECLAFARNPSGIYRLTVPTGGAKTLSSMRYAITHANKYDKKRIFYIGPYLSILEQNSQVFRQALGEETLILEHHSNVIMESEEEEFHRDRYRHLTENWDNPIIITTFVQFLNTLFAGNTGSVRRFHNLSQSVIIIDEIQSLPMNMLHLFNMAINYLSKICQTTVVLCSATQPALEDIPVPIHMSNPPDMITDVDGLFKKLKRVRVEPRPEIMTTEQLCGFLKKKFEKETEMLVILNTKAAVAAVYRTLDSLFLESGEQITLIHLSTSMCAEHRLSRIDKIRNRRQGERLICISTSLIEAGVDISFSCVVRSYAGLDCIVQSAGRCNRNVEQKEGTLYLIHYAHERLGNLEQVRKGAACTEAIIEQFQKDRQRFHDDLLSRPALNAYYKKYYCDPDQYRLMNYPVETKGFNMVDMLSENRKGKKIYWEKYEGEEDLDLTLYQAFKTAGKSFEVIEQNTIGVLVPYGEGEEIISKLNGEFYGKEITVLLRKGQRFTVNFYRDKIEKLTKAGALALLKNGKVLALKSGFYDSNLGVVIDGKEEFLLV